MDLPSPSTSSSVPSTNVVSSDPTSLSCASHSGPVKVSTSSSWPPSVAGKAVPSSAADAAAAGLSDASWAKLEAGMVSTINVASAIPIDLLRNLESMIKGNPPGVAGSTARRAGE